jgi:drug/metabolite transporter (DMT)-like permease
VAAVNLSYYLAIDHLPVGVAVSLQYTGPAMVLAVTALAGSAPRHGRLAWLAAGITLAGAVLVSRALEGLGGLDVPGVAAGLASAVTFAAYLLTAELAGRRGAHPATTLLWGFLTAVAIWSLVAPWWSWPLEALGDPGVALAVAGVGVVGTLVPFALAVGAVRVISAATAGIAATSEPLFAAAFAWVLLGQRLAPPQLAGGALVVAGVVLAQLAAAAAGPDRRPRGAGRPAPG